MSDEAKMLLICLGLPAMFALFGIFYFAWQDWLISDATKKAIEAQKEIYLNMPEKCKECPYCKAKDEKMSRSSRRRYNLSLANAPHRRCNKWATNYKAWECRHGQIDPCDCTWYQRVAGCPWSRLGINCNAVQEGHWTLIFMNCWCRDERRYNERRKKAHPA